MQATTCCIKKSRIDRTQLGPIGKAVCCDDAAPACIRLLGSAQLLFFHSLFSAIVPESTTTVIAVILLQVPICRRERWTASLRASRRKHWLHTRSTCRGIHIPFCMDTCMRSTTWAARLRRVPCRYGHVHTSLADTCSVCVAAVMSLPSALTPGSQQLCSR